MKYTLLTAALAGLSLAAQLPFGLRQSMEQQLSPESASSHITSDGFTTLSHPDFLDHSVRIKKSTGGCDEASAYTGYIDNGPRHLFFYFFESRSEPTKDPLMLWTNGGPGCSSGLGLFMELGPCTTQPDGNSTKTNPNSWNSKANIIFIDQPIGVGLSYATSGAKVGTSEEAAVDVYAFLSIFLETFGDYKGREFHLSGESYGGRYLPVFASEIVYQNDMLKRSGSKRTPINLKSVLIGNGLSDVVSMATSYYDQACTKASGIGHPVLDIKTCVEMQQSVKRCDKWLDRVCRQSVITPECDIAAAYCNAELMEPFIYGGINPYNIAQPCTTLAEDLCYPETSVIKTYLDQPWVRKELGVDPHVGAFQSCSPTVGRQFGETKDGMAATFFHITGLLENDIRVLIYVGKLDWICNFIGNSRMVEGLSWSGQEGFNNASSRSWSVPGSSSGVSAGDTKSFGKLSFVTIEDAGHMVPYDKPVESLHMLTSWLEGKDL